MITIFENIINSFESIMSNKLRSSLSMLGIIIGVCSVIVLTAIGNGSQKAIVENVQAFGTNLLTITAGSSSSANSRETTNILTYQLSQNILNSIPNIKSIAPQITSNSQAIYGSNNTRVSIIGTTNDYFETKNTKMILGGNILPSHIDNLEKKVIIGYTIYQDLYNLNNPIGTNIKIGNNIYEVVGVIEEKSNNIDTSVIIPITTAQIRQIGSKNLSSIEISVTDSDKVNETKDLLEKYLLGIIGKAENDGSFSIRNQADMLERFSAITSTLTILLSGIAGISLLVGGIGVMNIMLVSVTERTKEIGIRKAIGANKIDILTQFLIESLVLSLFGGIIGIILSYIIVFILLNYFSVASVIDTSSILLSFFVALFIGVFFGLLPAYKASKLRPIDALRFE